MYNGNCDCGYGHSATSAHVDLSIDNNTTWSDAFQFDDPDDTTWTLDGCSFTLDVQVTYYDLEPKLSLSSAAGTILIADPIKRVIYFSVPAAAVQAGVLPGTYVYDLIMTDALGVRTALMHGQLEVSQGVTGV
jgi:hypothetical protein